MPGKDIVEFYNSDSFLLIGMSKKRKNFAWGIYKSFITEGKAIFPIHPDGGEKKGVKFYSGLDDLENIPASCIICADFKQSTDTIIKLRNFGVKRFWFQQGSYDDELLTQTRQLNADVLTGCVLMYLPGTSFPHKLHRFFHELFSKGKN